MRPVLVRAGILIAMVLMAVGWPARAIANLQFTYTTGSCGFVVGDTLDVSLTVDDTVLDLRGFLLRLQFDPAVVEVVSVSLGELVDGPVCPFYPMLLQVDADSIAVDAAGLGCSVSGPGEILHMRFVGLGFGQSILECLESQLRDSVNQPIPHSCPQTTIECGPPASQIDLLPGHNTLLPGETIDLELTVTAACDSFNAYETTIYFDDSYLTFVELPEAVQEGELMTSACGNRFHDFVEENGVISITHVLLCPNQTVMGPGVLYRLRFQANISPAIVDVRITNTRLVDGGIALSSPRTTDSRIQIGTVTGVPGEDQESERFGVLYPAYPNPFRGDVKLSFALSRHGWASLSIYSVSGRLVQRLMDRNVEAGERHTAVWDGLDARGKRVAPGLYFAVLRTEFGTRSQRIVKIE